MTLKYVSYLYTHFVFTLTMKSSGKIFLKLSHLGRILRPSLWGPEVHNTQNNIKFVSKCSITPCSSEIKDSNFQSKNTCPYIGGTRLVPPPHHTPSLVFTISMTQNFLVNTQKLRGYFITFLFYCLLF